MRDTADHGDLYCRKDTNTNSFVDLYPKSVLTPNFIQVEFWYVILASCYSVFCPVLPSFAQKVELVRAAGSNRIKNIEVYKSPNRQTDLAAYVEWLRRDQKVELAAGAFSKLRPSSPVSTEFGYIYLRLWQQCNLQFSASNSIVYLI